MRIYNYPQQQVQHPICSLQRSITFTPVPSSLLAHLSHL